MVARPFRLMLDKLKLYAAPATAFAISIAFVPGISGAATSPRWAIATISLWWMDWQVLPFIAICFAVLDFDAAVHWAIISAAFCWGLKHDPDTSGMATVKRTVKAFGMGIGVSSIATVLQSAGWSGIPQAIGPAGLFANKNILGEAACLALIASLIYRQWLASVMILPALLLTTTRAAWLGASIGLLFILPVRWRLSALAIAPFPVLLIWWLGYLNEATLLQRLALWQDAVQNLSWLGNGSYDYSTVTYRDPHLHNDWLQLVYELGVVGLIPLAAILAANRNPQAVPFVAALLVIGSFGFPLQMPATAWFAAFIIGHSLGYVLDERRMVLRARSGGDEPSTTTGQLTFRA